MMNTGAILTMAGTVKTGIVSSGSANDRGSSVCPNWPVRAAMTNPATRAGRIGGSRLSSRRRLAK